MKYLIALLVVLSLSAGPSCAREVEITYEEPARNLIKGLIFITEFKIEKLEQKASGQVKVKKQKKKLYNYELLTGSIYQTEKKLKGVPDLRSLNERHRKIAFTRDAIGVVVPIASIATPFALAAGQ